MRALLKLILIIILLPLIMFIGWLVITGIVLLIGLIAGTGALIVDGWFWLFIISILVIVLLAIFCN